MGVLRFWHWPSGRRGQTRIYLVRINWYYPSWMLLTMTFLYLSLCNRSSDIRAVGAPVGIEEYSGETFQKFCNDFTSLGALAQSALSPRVRYLLYT